jgi:hypothetical protein
VARIRPGTMPVRLPGVAQAIQQIGPTRWQPNQIQVMREAERIRKRQEAGEGVDPREIAAWAQLAQIILKDDTLVGGLVNMLSRKSRESAVKERQEAKKVAAKQQAERQAAEEAQARGDWPYGVPGLQEQHDAALPQYGRIQELQAKIVESRDPAEKSQMAIELQDLRQSLQSRGIEPPPPAPLIQQASAPVAQEQITETVAEAPAPAQPAPDRPITRQQVYQDLLREEAEQRKSELANIEKVVRERELTVSDLYGLAATAKSPEVVRTLMAMVPKVVEQDPAYAPRSLAELLFGGTDKTQQISKELISLWGQSQKARRGDDYTRRVERRAKTEERMRLLDVEEERRAAQAAQRRAAAGLSDVRGEDIEATREARIAKLEAEARKADEQASKLARRYLRSLRARSKGATR